jgi:Ca2+-binding EF-hand superfamily protein
MRSLFIATLAVGVLSAQEGRGPGGPGMNFIRISPILAAIDADEDGVISAAELKNAPSALRKLDKNGDGQLTQDEVRPNFPGRGQGRGPGRGEEREATGPTPAELQQTLMAFDKNKDGKLSKEEMPERMRGMFDQGDTNHDGFLTADEIGKVASALAAPAGGEGRGGGRGEGRGEGRGPGGPRGDMAFAALDTDHDGVVSAEEIKNSAVSLKTFDRNGDGQLTEDEVRPAFGGNGGGRGGDRGQRPDGPPQQ